MTIVVLLISCQGCLNCLNQSYELQLQLSVVYLVHTFFCVSAKNRYKDLAYQLEPFGLGINLNNLPDLANNIYVLGEC